MSTTLHHPRAAATGSHPALLSGNTYATRPTKLDPIACDCCHRSIGWQEARRSMCTFPFGTLHYVLCPQCNRVEDFEDRPVKLGWMLTRAGRFGQQFREAVQAQLGWQA
ncbi:hypothetical protein ACDH63_12735 [Xanthomonas axonopodis pv. maculifoliigardeniae]|uniref:hypothetical protein n=1 Tax=Xanthomonas axonopodis TaxID=53413 RepID=UPI00355894DD